MNLDQGVILAMYAVLGGVLLLAGFVYKEVRNRRARRNTPTFNFPPKEQDTKKDVHEHHLAATR
jgi:hypothetical protein